jgi:hypothetical protein
MSAPGTILDNEEKLPSFFQGGDAGEANAEPAGVVTLVRDLSFRERLQLVLNQVVSPAAFYTMRINFPMDPVDGRTYSPLGRPRKKKDFSNYIPINEKLYL